MKINATQNGYSNAVNLKFLQFEYL